MERVYHALVLNLHQPSGNLDWLWEHHNWEAKEILWALDRMPRALWDYEDVARVHLSLSGTLLETLADPSFQAKVYGTMKCGDLLWHLQNGHIFEILGTGYYHPVLPLTPAADRAEHLSRWQGLAEHLFWRNRFRGFWPPEMGFCEELIPLLRQMGYDYVLVDNEYVEPEGPYDWASQRYRPYLASYQGSEIVVVPRDRELSNAQLSGMDPGWFMHEVHERTKNCDFPPLVTTASDGDNGGWFRNTNEYGNFWHVFYRPFLDAVRGGTCEIKPTFVHDYIARFGHGGPCKVHRGAWNTEDHQGWDFHQWTGSSVQREGWARLAEVSRHFHQLEERLAEIYPEGLPGEVTGCLEQAHWRLLRAETSCNFYWGETWVPRAHADLDEVVDRLKNIPGLPPVEDTPR